MSPLLVSTCEMAEELLRRVGDAFATLSTALCGASKDSKAESHSERSHKKQRDLNGCGAGQGQIGTGVLDGKPLTEDAGAADYRVAELLEVESGEQINKVGHLSGLVVKGLHRHRRLQVILLVRN